MITLATLNDKSMIRELWQEAFAFDDGGFTDFFFDQLYETDGMRHYILKDPETVSTASVYSHMYRINNQNLRVSMILGVATKSAKRRKGYMHQLMDAILDDLSHQELITMIQAYHPEIYYEFGFKTIYHQNYYEIKREDQQLKLFGTVTDNFSITDLLTVYGRFVKHFHGFKLRFEKDYALLLTKLKFEDSKVLVYYQDKLPQAYCFYHEYPDKTVVEEIIYLDLKGFISLLSMLFEKTEMIELHLSSDEQIEKYIQVEKQIPQAYTMAKINDIKLFNKLYNSDVKNVEEAFNLIDKPLFMREEY